MNEEEFWEVVDEVADLQEASEGLKQGIIALSEAKGATKQLLEYYSDLEEKIAYRWRQIEETPEFETVFHYDRVSLLESPLRFARQK